MTSSVSSNRWLLAVLLVLPLLFARPRSGQADVGHDFRLHYEAALHLYDHGQFEGAVKEFQAAYALKQLPRLLLNIGQAHRKLGHARDALGFYEFYLRVEPNPKPEIKAELTTYIAQTRALLDAAERMRAQQEPLEPPPQNEPLLAPRAPAGSAVTPTPVVLIPPPPTTTPAERLAVVGTPVAPPPPPTPNLDQAGGRPVYKKWSFKEKFGGDGGACWNRTHKVEKPPGWEHISLLRVRSDVKPASLSENPLSFWQGFTFLECSSGCFHGRHSRYRSRFFQR